MPQVATDYRINMYFRNSEGIYVNLYLPSTVRWAQSGAQVSLTQETGYPLDEVVHFDITASKPAEFSANFRVPAWAEGASISVNGKRISTPTAPGSFATIRRKWRTGDRLEVHLPMRTRLEAIDSRHMDTVALLNGPLVLFPTNKTEGAITRRQLLAAKKSGTNRWQIATGSGSILMLPFFAIEEERYSTYLKVS